MHASTIIVDGTDGNKYEVIADYNDSAAAAKLIGEVNSDIIRFLRYMRDKYLVYRNVRTGETAKYGQKFGSPEDWAPLRTPNLVNIVERIVSKYNPEVISENRPGGKDTSYTVNKGKQLVLCLRDAKTHQLHDKATVEFVVLHEISHMGNENWGHSQEDYWPTFKFILWEAINFGIVPAIDYGRAPVKYCGIGIKYSPAYDKTLPNIWA